MTSSREFKPESPYLERRLGLGACVALNITDMVGVGPFLTLPLIVGAVGGPLVIVAWIAGGVLALCDSLIWAELAATMPEAGGSYAYLKRIYGEKTWGRLLSFLFAFQLIFSAPLSIASGCIGLGKYAAYLLPGLERVYWRPAVEFNFFGRASLPLEVSGSSLLAAGAAALVTLLVYRRVDAIGRLAKVFLGGVLLTLLWMIVAGLTHFHAGLLMDGFRGGGFGGGTGKPLQNPLLIHAMSAGLLLATYDYWGYYNVCFLGEEVRRPERTIPRAMLISIGVVTALYVLMNVGVLGVMPWREVASVRAMEQLNIAAVFMTRIYGHWAGTAIAALVAWTAFASVFALLTGYSRIPYAAARDGNFFGFLKKLHPVGGFPHRAVLMLGGTAFLFCFLRLSDVITALVVLRVCLQFLLQAFGLLYLRAKHPEVKRPFRMWLYPVPALVAIAGFVLVLEDKAALIARGAVLAAGVAGIFVWRQWRGRQWPFGEPEVL